ncbi:MAG: hypothetical protein R2748_16225 [Bryobacterales bacterium]
MLQRRRQQPRRALLRFPWHRSGSLADQPDGRNINVDCGSLHLERLQEKVRQSGADLGVAFDGDADRALLVADDGSVVDGDAILL